LFECILNHECIMGYECKLQHVGNVLVFVFRN